MMRLEGWHRGPVTCSVIYHLQDSVLLPKSLLGTPKKVAPEKLTSQGHGWHSGVKVSICHAMNTQFANEMSPLSWPPFPTVFELSVWSTRAHLALHGKLPLDTCTVYPDFVKFTDWERGLIYSTWPIVLEHFPVSESRVSLGRMKYLSSHVATGRWLPCWTAQPNAYLFFQQRAV